MTMLWVNEAIERLPPLGYRTRIIACAAAAAVAPLLLLRGGAQIGPVIASGLVATWFLFCVHRLLLPLRDLATALDACVGAIPPESAEAPRGLDEIERMTMAADRLSELLQAAMSRELDAMIAPASRDLAGGREISSAEQDPRRKRA